MGGEGTPKVLGSEVGSESLLKAIEPGEALGLTQPPPGCEALPGAAHAAGSATLGTSDGGLRPQSLRSWRQLLETPRS